MPSMSFAERDQQAADRRVIRGLFPGINLRAGLVLEAQQLGQVLRRKTESLTALHPEYASPDHRDVAAYWVVLIAMPMVCLLDFLLVSNAAEYLATLLFMHQPTMILIARLCAPAGFLVVELLFAVKLQAAVRKAEEGGGRAAVKGWVAAGLLWAGAISAMVLASQLAAHAAGDVPLQGAAMLLTSGIAVVAFLLHLLILMGGRQLRDSNGYLAYELKQSWYGARSRRTAHREMVARSETAQAFGRVVSEVGAYNRRYPLEPFFPSPFSRPVRQVLGDEFGAQALPADETFIRGVLSAGLGNGLEVSEPSGRPAGEEEGHPVGAA